MCVLHRLPSARVVVAARRMSAAPRKRSRPRAPIAPEQLVPGSRPRPTLLLMAVAFVLVAAVLGLLVVYPVLHWATRWAPHRPRKERRPRSTAPLAEKQLHALIALEEASNSGWNVTRTILLLGLKARRDFHVYDWPFREHGFKMSWNEQPLELRSKIGAGIDSPKHGTVGVVACHSIFTHNCIRMQSRFPMLSGWGDHTQDSSDDHALVFSMLRRGQKMNRISFARKVLTTKDGFCDMLRSLHIPLEQLWGFTFPCWLVPRDYAALRRRVLEALAAPAADADAAASHVQADGAEPDAAAAAAAARPTMATLAGASGLWILKPARGSEGKGIRLLNRSQLLDLMQPPSGRLTGLFGGFTERGPSILQPYLRQPLLRDGYKWDMRTYVLCTSVLPMRVYVFSEAIVRYASSRYDDSTGAKGVMLTNTFVGKQETGGGVGAITGSLAELAEALAPLGLGHARVLREMRLVIGRLFLAAEPAFAALYRRAYPTWLQFRCAACYHLFGVDLIADSHRQLHVIEVNIAPDLTLSTEGVCETSAQGCAGGSNKYDHTKTAAAYSTVRLVFSSLSAAATLDAMLARHGDELPARFPRLHRRACTASSNSTAARAAGAEADASVPADATAWELRPFVQQYLLDAVREGRSIGCYLPVYPSAVGGTPLLQHLQMLHRFASKAPPPQTVPPQAQPTEDATYARSQHVDECIARDALRCAADEGEAAFERTSAEAADDEAAHGGGQDSGWCGFDAEGRIEMHNLLMLLLYGAGPSATGTAAAPPVAWQEPYKAQCEHMLGTVPHVSQGAWARRTHVFREVVDAPI